MRRIAPTLSVILALSLLDCTSTRMLSGPLDANKGKSVRVSLLDGTQHDGKLLDVDSAGTILLRYDRWRPPLALGADSVVGVEYNAFDPLKSLLLVGTAFVGIMIIALATFPREGYGW